MGLHPCHSGVIALVDNLLTYSVNTSAHINITGSMEEMLMSKFKLTWSCLPIEN